MKPSVLLSIVFTMERGSGFLVMKYVVSVSGGRQECKLGALIFNMIYSLALKRLRRALAPHKVVLRIVQVGDNPFWS